MWLRLALKLFALLCLYSACSSPDRQVVDKLNSLSYACHYRSLDSTEYYAREALTLVSSSDGSGGIHDGADAQAEALNNLAFVSLARMQYDHAALLLDSVAMLTDNQLELLVANVQQMRLCQRRSKNREFYDYREKAQQALKRINEERTILTDRQQQRLAYAETELAIVTSTYYYYVGLAQQSIDELAVIDWVPSRDLCEETDMPFTPQLLNYLYNVGAGGIITTGTQEEINQQEFDCLMRCLLLSRLYHYPYFEANAMEALADHLINPVYREQLLGANHYAESFLNTDEVVDDELPAQLAEGALCLFQQYGDIYQIAGAYRTLASCARANGNNASALYYLEQALSDSLISQAPDLVASIREQLSVAYAAIDDKVASDQNRNIYLDLQEQTRQDRWLEARAAQLDATVSRLNVLLIIIGAAILLLIVQIVYLHVRRMRKKDKENEQQDERVEEIKERLAISRMHIIEGTRHLLEQRAKVSLASSITPFIDRMLYEAGRHPIDKQYICELTEKINEQNDLLTHWIQLRQGQLNLHIETFALQPLFDIVARGRKAFDMKGVELQVYPTTLCVKADRVLTLFMLNTLADNARKFTQEGGRVTVSAQETDLYVELSVTDTGKGMDEEQLEHVFDRKAIVDKSQAEASANSQSSHGFGLLNCRGIIEKYRKTSNLFAVCMIAAESQLGKGSRFFFRLPKGVLRLLLCLMVGTASLQAQNVALTNASAYADSAYYANINGNYARAILFADICRQSLNNYYHQIAPDRTDSLLFLGDLSNTPPEVIWLHDSIPVNYDILLTMRNESAVAALALHQWDIYAYNNKIYTSLFKELSADTQLEQYCRRMQQSQTNYTIAIVILVLILAVILSAIVAQIMQSSRRKALRQQERLDSIEMLEDDLRKAEMEEGRLHVSNQMLDNCLSALKHETMYYPSRIRQLVDKGDTADLQEIVGYYRDLYSLLSLQATVQVENVKLRLKPLGHEILGDEYLIDYLFELLKKQSGQKEPLHVTYTPRDERHVECRVRMPNLKLTDVEAARLFVPTNGPEGEQHIPYLLCRQIVRDHGEASGRRGCGIWAEIINGQTIIVIILPRQICKTSK